VSCNELRRTSASVQIEENGKSSATRLTKGRQLLAVSLRTKMCQAAGHYLHQAPKKDCNNLNYGEAVVSPEQQRGLEVSTYGELSRIARII